MTQVLVISNTRIYRDGLSNYINNLVGFEAESIPAENYQKRVIEHQPDVILVDYSVPARDLVIKNIAGIHANENIIAISVPELEEAIIACAESGAVGYITINASFEELIQAIESAIRGEMHCSPRVVRAMARRLSEFRVVPTFTNPIGLTTRETQIAKLLVKGLPNKKIALELGISPSTVKVHVSKILDKLQVSCRAEAAAQLRDCVMQ